MSIVGLGWGRATRTTSLSDTVQGEAPVASVGALTTDADAADAPTVGGKKGTPKPAETEPIGEESREDIPSASDLFEPGTTARVIFLRTSSLDCDARGVSGVRFCPSPDEIAPISRRKFSMILATSFIILHGEKQQSLMGWVVIVR